MKKVEVEFTFTKNTVVVTCQTPAPNALGIGYGEIVAAGRPSEVSTALRGVFVGVLQAPALKVVEELAEQGGD